MPQYWPDGTVKTTHSAFTWATGARSCMWTEAGERIAQKIAKAAKTIDRRGRHVVDLKPLTKGAISIHTGQDTQRNQRIALGRSI